MQMRRSWTHRQSIYRLFPLSALTVAVLATCGAAYAQQDPNAVSGTSAAPEATTIDRLTVTGSNLRRSDTETPSPVQVLTAQQIQQSGYTDISDVLHNISANGSGSLSQGFGSAFAAGASGIALRGLSVGATLVLIDGHRSAPYALTDDGEREFTDISQIPLEAIDRIEILKDGASSIYGSDAIAGVVNIILKKSYVGQTATADFGVTKYMDGRTRHFAGMIGAGDLDADGHNGYVSFEYREQDPILAQDRPYLAQTDFHTQTGGVNLSPGFPSPANSFLAGSNTGYFVDPTGATTTGPFGTSITGFLPGCNAYEYSKGACTYTLVNNYIQPPTQNLNVLGSFTQNLPYGFQLNIKASLFDEHSASTQLPQNTAWATGPEGTIGQLITSIGPNQTPGVAGPFYPIVPANYPGNKTGAPQYLVANFSTETPYSDVDSQTYRIAADLTGTVWGWDTSLAVGFSENLIYQTETGFPDYKALDAALASTTNFYYVGNQFYKNTAAQNAAVFPTLYGKSTDQLSYITGQASHELFTLPGGPMEAGVGFDYRHQALSSIPSGTIQAGYVDTYNQYAVGNQNVGAVFGEIEAPIYKQFEIDASVRHDAYAGSFSDTTPKIGFKLSPIDQVTFRGTYSEGFRAPNPAEVGDAGEAFGANNYTDPRLCPNPGGKTGAGNFPSACAFPVVSIQTPGIDLQPEKSRSYTGGFILEPIKGYSVSLDYYDIKVNNQILSAFEDPYYAGSTPVYAAPEVLAYNQPNGAGGYTVVNKLTPVGPIAYIPYPYINASYTHVDGVDLDARAKFDMGTWGKLTADLTETHVFQYQQAFAGGPGPYELAGTHGPSGVSGDTGNPRDRAQFVLVYDRGPLTVSATTSWTSSFNVTDPSSGLLSCADAMAYSATGFFTAAYGVYPPSVCRVKASTSEDVYINYKLNKQWSIHGSILNLFNQNASLDFQTYGGGTFDQFLPYQPNWSQAQAVGRFYTVGATYRFE